jgi:hypothetical protein
MEFDAPSISFSTDKRVEEIYRAKRKETEIDRPFVSPWGGWRKSHHQIPETLAIRNLYELDLNA